MIDCPSNAMPGVKKSYDVLNEPPPSGSNSIPGELLLPLPNEPVCRLMPTFTDSFCNIPSLSSCIKLVSAIAVVPNKSDNVALGNVILS